MIFAALFFLASLVNDVRGLIAQHNLTAAEQRIRGYQVEAGGTPELAAAVSWLGRGELEAKDYNRADTYASEARRISLDLLRSHKLDSDPWLPTALGASIEVHAQVLAARGERGQAVSFLREQAKLFANTSLVERINKNINLLSLVGRPAPALEEKEWFGPKPPPLSQLKGHPVLLFFWAHWCPDCKSEAPILAGLQKKFGPQGLVILGPTRFYGFVGGGDEAPPNVERQYIEAVRAKFYPMLSDMPAPLSAANFQAYGASSTPTIVLLDAAGIVRYYHPGAASEAELTAQIEPLLRK